MTDNATTWNERYSESERLWSGQPNVSLVRETADLTPGTALDLGCGEGADAVWLAARGWRVTGVDASTTALARATAHAEDAGVSDRVRFEPIDLARALPAGPFDLVCAHYIHTHGTLDLLDLVSRAAAIVAPGGHLLVVVHTAAPGSAGHGSGHGHGGEDHGHGERPFVVTSAEEIMDAVRAVPGDWTTVSAATFEREGRAPGGQVAVRTDLAVRVRRG
jgi:SAM-dependent methyltransferase